ncbi:MAG: FecR family protein [Fimbriimonadaceae bacterium]|nr:FecR family protein [Fimbriimonadaceae bacterium]
MPLTPPMGRVVAIDPCRIAGVSYGEGDMPQDVPTGIGGVRVEIYRGSARLKLINSAGKGVGSIVLVGPTTVDFKKSTLFFPIGFTLNAGSIDCESNANECQLTIGAGTCSIVTTGTHFQVDRNKSDVKVSVFEGSVSVTPSGLPAETILYGNKGNVGPTTSGSLGLNRGTMDSVEKQFHNTGPAHWR